MTIQQFIFSGRTTHRVARHAAFWLIYSFHFYVQSIPPKTFAEFFTATPYITALINTVCFGFFYMAVTYFFIYTVYPNCIKKEKYLSFVIAFVVAYGIGVFCNYYMAGFFLHYSNYQTNTADNRLSLSYCNTRWGMIIAIVGTGIKLSKDWYIQEKANAIILKKKNRAEIQLQKGRINPVLLLHTLDDIHASVENNFSNSGSMILKLSDVLSYSLYETDDKLVPAEKEIENVKNLFALQQLSGNSDHLILHTEGNFAGRYIAPMVLIKIFEKCITLFQHDNIKSNTEMTITAKDDTLLVNINCDDTRMAKLQQSIAGKFDQSYYRIYVHKQHTENVLTFEIKLFFNKENSQQPTEPLYEYA